MHRQMVLTGTRESVWRTMIIEAETDSRLGGSDIRAIP
jgi:hypothetical protein